MSISHRIFECDQYQKGTDSPTSFGPESFKFSITNSSSLSSSSILGIRAGIRKFDENNDLDLMYDGYLFFVFLHPISTNFHHLNVFPDTVFY
ncbi:hypothetical protein RCL_jg26652.t1 [Rhizophagus clarus]|uniref:Uncharacterized protein n=1 Tax=Rhizophagus clarus TaxID=94130 RepID=A0A8H3QZZ0_9GLOM|nr:hypothetical protein RCL_jg26652.t1 [Rhizophagus clarus]